VSISLRFPPGFCFGRRGAAPCRPRDETRRKPQAVFFWFVTVGILLTVVGPVFADDPSLELEVSPPSVRVGDRVEVLASARGGDGWLWGELTVTLDPGGDWELVDGPTAIPEARPPVWKLELAPMALGEQSLPFISVSARSSDGETVEIESAGPMTVSVVSILADEEEDPAPAPLRDPIGVRGFPWEWVLPITGVMLPLLVGVAWWWRGRGRPVVADRAFLRPLAELEALVSELDGRVGREPADGVCDRLAAGLRHYLERRTGEPAEEMTSFELRLLARNRGWPELSQRLVQRAMGVADGVRFGRRPSTDEELHGAIAQALDAARSVEAFLDDANRDPVAREAGA